MGKGHLSSRPSWASPGTLLQRVGRSDQVISLATDCSIRTNDIPSLRIMMARSITHYKALYYQHKLARLPACLPRSSPCPPPCCRLRRVAWVTRPYAQRQRGACAGSGCLGTSRSSRPIEISPSPHSMTRSPTAHGTPAAPRARQTTVMPGIAYAMSRPTIISQRAI